MTAEQTQAASTSPTLALTRQGVLHFAVWLLAFSLFAATDSWTLLTGWPMAAFLNILTGIIAGFLTVNLAHEWSHYLGARATGADYHVAEKPSLFIFDWNFESNGLGRFFAMSIAGTVGGGVALLALFLGIEPDNAGRAALLAGAAASFALGAFIEWPVLLRTVRSGDPFAELAKLSPPVLGSAVTGSVAVGVACWFGIA